MPHQIHHRRLFNTPLLCAVVLIWMSGSIAWFEIGKGSAQSRPKQPIPPRNEQARAAAHRSKRLPPGGTEIPVERYLKAQGQMERMPRYSTAADRFDTAPSVSTSNLPEQQSWTPLGPGNFGGRTRSLVVHPSNPNIIYAASLAGGVWKTVNSGVSWTPLVSLLPTLPVSTLVLDPANPNIIFAATGENFAGSDALPGAGIFRSGDAGANWARLTGTATPDFRYVNDLVVSSIDSQRLYAATRTGVWQSINGGANWQRVIDPRPFGAGESRSCYDLAIRTDTTSDFLFATCQTSNSSGFIGTAIYRNVDAAGGARWDIVYTETGGMGRTSLAIAPSDQNVIYALTANAPTSVQDESLRHSLLAVYRSTQFGNPGTWIAQARGSGPDKLNTVLLSNPLLAFAAECGIGASVAVHRGDYANVIAVDPANPDRVWVGGVDLFRSDDGGRNWALASYWWADRSRPQFVRADQHAIVFHPQYDGLGNKTLFVAGDGGIYRTDDAQAAAALGAGAACDPDRSSVRWSALNNSYAVTQFNHGLPLPDGKSYFGGTLDQGLLLGTESGGANGWRELSSGDGGYVAINPTNPEVFYATNPGLMVQKSTNRGLTFSRADTGIVDTRSLFVAPLVMDPSDPQRLWTGGCDLYRTENGAATWQRARPAGSSCFGREVSAIAIAQTDSNRVVVGSRTGSISRTNIGLTADANTSWQGTAPREGFVSWLAFDPVDHSIVYATYSSFNARSTDRHVYRSVDGGASWRAIDGAGATALPDVPVHCLVVDPQNPMRLWVGTDLGVFVTIDAGTNWAVEGAGLPTVAVESLALNTTGEAMTLYAFTSGRGAWRVSAGAASCRFTLSATRRLFEAAGGTGNIAIDAQSDCPRTARSNADWLTITSGASGSGAGSVSFSVAPQSSVNRRVGTLTVAGKSFAIEQAGSRDVTPPTIIITAPAAGATFVTEVSSITISGTASDDLMVTEVRWSSDRGDNRVASGTSNWTFTIKNDGFFGLRGLASGPNPITITARDAAGNIRRANINIISRPSHVVTTIAGWGRAGQFNNSFGGDGGPGGLAFLSNPEGVALDAAGNVFIADTRNHRIRRVTPEGIISTIAGTGVPGFAGDGGPALQAQFSSPRRVVVDASGNLFIADTDNHRVRKITSAGMITTVAGNGTSGSSGDGGTATSATLNFPKALALDAAGNLFIGAESQSSRIRKVDTAGIITTVAPLAASGLAFDARGNLFAADSFGHRVRRIAPDGTVTIVVGNGNSGFGGDGGLAVNAELNVPQGIAFDVAGNLYISDGRIRKVDPAGVITLFAGGGGREVSGDGGAAIDAQMDARDLAIDQMGRLWVADTNGNRLRLIVPVLAADTTPPVVTITDPTTNPTLTTSSLRLPLGGTAFDDSGVTQVQWRNDRGGSGVANGTNGWAVLPRNIGNVLVPTLRLQAGENRITVTAWDAVGNSGHATLTINCQTDYAVFAIGGNGTTGFSGDDGPGAAAQLSTPTAIAYDTSGNLYFADTDNNRIRRIAPNGTITTVAGNGQIGTGDQAGPALAAALNRPQGVAVDGAGNLYVADTGNNRVCLVNPQGLLSTVAGNGTPGFSGDGGVALGAQLRGPRELAFDGLGNLYIADTDNHRIRRVSKIGLITTVAGRGFGYSGDGGTATLARLKSPQGLTLDASGNLFIADTGNARIRKVTPAGLITTVAGSGEGGGFVGDGVQATAARLFAPASVAVDGAGDLYITDKGPYQSDLSSTDFGRLRRVRASNGMIETLAGLRSFDESPNRDGNVASEAQLSAPQGVRVGGNGIIYVADAVRHQIYKFTPRVATLANVSAASFLPGLATEAIATAFGTNLAVMTQVATTLPLPMTLAGTRVSLRDSAGIERQAPIFFVSPSQINYQLPPGLISGQAVITVTTADGSVSVGTTQINSVAPGLFSANSNGNGVATGLALRIRSDGTRAEEPIASFDPATVKFVANPIELGAETDQVFLILFGTGLRNRSGLDGILASIGGIDVPVLFAGAQGSFVGLDQINIQLPRSLTGRGDLDIALIVDGQPANIVRIRIK